MAVNKAEAVNKRDEENFAGTFAEIEASINNIEQADVNVNWGSESSITENSNWISLKQYLLYLCSRFTPQSLIPFVELIPNISVDANPMPKKDEAMKQALKDSSSTWVDVNKSHFKDIENEQKKDKYGTLPPGYNTDRFKNGGNALNNASDKGKDLFSLDPFGENTQEVADERGVGVRVYGQLVLSPSSKPNTPSKPGAIGFTKLEINTGNQASNGLAMISMELLDVQGNKFTDVNSPWAFIFDARPGSQEGDFWFRYGWQIRVPVFGDKEDMFSNLFWNHPGWNLFGGAKDTIAKRIIPGKQTITLTQSLNFGSTDESNVVEANIGTIFDEGVDYDPVTQKAIINKTRLITEANYVKLSILNPKISVNKDGSLTGSLSFATTGSVVDILPLDYAFTVRKLIKNETTVNLKDLLLAVMEDNALGNLLTVGNVAEKQRRREDTESKYESLRKAGDISNLVYLIGASVNLETGVSSNDNISPESIDLKISPDRLIELTQPNKDNPTVIIGWLRKVLEENECSLLSAATGSGTGINSTWVIATTKILDANKVKILPRETSAYSTTYDMLTLERDVFSFRFQGSLVEELDIDRTDAPNMLKIQVDTSVNGLATFDVTSTEEKKVLVTPGTRKAQIINLFSQMQNCTVTALCHPWIGPGKQFYVKGNGFYDGRYLVLECTHTLGLDNKFISKIKGARFLVPSIANSLKENTTNAQEDGAVNIAEDWKKQINPFVKKDPPLITKKTPYQPASNPENYLVTVDDLMQIGLNPNRERLNKIIEPLNEGFNKYEINSYLRICHFLGQVMEETGDFSKYSENLNYSAEGLLKTFKTHFNETEAQQYARKPIKIASKAYANRFLNGNEASQDGWRYRGRGAIQLTFKSNYIKASETLGYDFLLLPDDIGLPYWGTIVAANYWSITKENTLGLSSSQRKYLNQLADIDDFNKICFTVQGARSVESVNNYAKRLLYYNKAKEVLIRLNGLS